MALHECKSGSDVIENYRQVRARMRQLKAPEQPKFVSVNIAPLPPVKVEIVEVKEETQIFVRQQEAEPPMAVMVYPSVARIIDVVGAKFKVAKSDIVSERRTTDIVRPRQIVMYLARHLTMRTLTEIGRYIGGRDHTTALFSVRKIAALRKLDPKMHKVLLELEEQLRPRVQ